MDNINTEFLDLCIDRLERASEDIMSYESGEYMHEVFRSFCVKEYELIEEQAGHLLRKRLRPFFASNQEVNRLTYKDVFRHAARHELISREQCERWFLYRDHRNNTAHRYGRGFAENTLPMLPRFVEDARALSRVISEGSDE